MKNGKEIERLEKKLAVLAEKVRRAKTTDSCILWARRERLVLEKLDKARAAAAPSKSARRVAAVKRAGAALRAEWKANGKTPGPVVPSTECGAFACGADLCNKECEKAGEAPARVHLADVVAAESVDNGNAAAPKVSPEELAGFKAETAHIRKDLAIVERELNAGKTYAEAVKTARLEIAAPSPVVTPLAAGAFNIRIDGAPGELAMYLAAPEMVREIEALRAANSELLAALETLINLNEGVNDGGEGITGADWDNARAAIRKARGE